MYHKYIGLLLLLSTCLAEGLLAQTVVIVKDLASQVAVAGASVRVYSQGRLSAFATTDLQGSSQVSLLYTTDSLLCEQVGYLPILLHGERLLRDTIIIALDASEPRTTHPWCASTKWPRRCCGDDFRTRRVYPQREVSQFWLCPLWVVAYRVPLVETEVCGPSYQVDLRSTKGSEARPAFLDKLLTVPTRKLEHVPREE